MVETGTLTDHNAVIRKAGANAVTISEAGINDFIAQAESEINVATRYNWTNNYLTLSTDVTGVLKQAASNLAGIYVISNDMDSIGRDEATDRISILRDSYLRCLGILRDKKAQTFTQDA